MIEKERKFLLTRLPETGTVELIKQAYLMIEGKKHLRVRIIDNTRSYVAVKIEKTPETRLEFEYPIPLSDAVELYNNTNIKLEKKRYKTTYMGNPVDIDIYPDGLGVVEIEYEKELTSLPDFCGWEITGKFEFSNIYIAMKKN